MSNAPMLSVLDCAASMFPNFAIVPPTTDGAEIEWPLYTEVGPQLVLRAFLDRAVSWPQPDWGAEQFVVECRLVREDRFPTRAIEKGPEQTVAYMDTSGASVGHMVVFDMHEGLS